MSETGRGVPRSQQKRGPKPFVARRAAAARGGGKHGDSVENADRHLLNYHTHVSSSREDDEYFRTTRSIVTAARRWRKLANERVKVTGQTMARWETLYLVAFTADELTQSELAHHISVEGPTMVRMLDALARDGLIERHQRESDRRVTTNRITRKGTQVIADLMEITNQLRREVLADIDPDKLATALEVMSDILRKLDEIR
ncbi:MarR family transcriptional regulator [Sphingomonas sp. ZT3P38]|uniref:MarR family winged helix-turn-helix transcriptional regulator n=1 Tax=Parasphingomonas zepuensis TaxID=3096161 RepID=UPI002FCC1756